MHRFLYSAGKHPDARKAVTGLTLLEVLAVLVILGVLGTVAMVRFTDIGARDAAAANMLKTHLRYAQLRAMGDIENWRVRILSNSYIIERSSNGTWEAVLLPDQEENKIDTGNVSLTPGSVTFSAGRGEPSGLHVISVGTRTISITEVTGFIRLSNNA